VSFAFCFVAPDQIWSLGADEQPRRLHRRRVHSAAVHSVVHVSYPEHAAVGLVWSVDATGKSLIWQSVPEER
jgi:hypothetical protein